MLIFKLTLLFVLTTSPPFLEGMKMPRVTQALRNFLMAQRKSHNGQDLLDRIVARLGALEIQTNVAADGGEPVEGKRSTYTDGEYEWFNFRIPKNAATAPEFRDWELRCPLELHAEGIGWTGWDWQARRSRALGFDFDAITAHAEGVGISKEELARVKEAACKLPCVEVRKSTGGKGIHLYVYFDEAGIPTANHTEHAALGRAILSMMSAEANFDFASHIDASGGNMWFWHRKMTPENEGLKLIKAAEKDLSVADLPANWMDHIEVVTRKRTKVRVVGITETEEDIFEAMVRSRPPVKLDEEHKRLMDWLGKNGYTSVWDQDHRLMVTHTAGLKAAHEAMQLKGAFETLATGKQQGDYNCFGFLSPNGAWTIYRFSLGTKETPAWRTSEAGWTFCQFNQRMELKDAATAYGGIKAPDGSFVLDSSDTGAKALKALGAELELPVWIAHREVTLKRQHGDLVAKIPCENSDKDADMRGKGWLKQNGNWVKVYELATEPEEEKPASNDFDDRLRHVVTPTMEDAGWAICDGKGRWIEEPKGNVKSVLKSWGLSDSKAEAVMGLLITDVWDLVNLPFQDEFPGNRLWNRDGAKLAFTPTERDRELSHRHWDMIFNHCGAGLDEAVKNSEWCRKHGIHTGGDYLRRWAAILFQRPTHPLPYLFFFSEQRGDGGAEVQNAGKSSFHQGLGLLMRQGKGYADADNALTNPQGFNRALAGAILCFVEETDLSGSKGTAYNRIKTWVTNDNISIHPKGIDPYMMPNTTHWVQCANKREACPVFVGDTRIVVIEVQPLPREEIPWKEEMRPALEKEAPDFLRMLLDLPLPPSAGRLWLPVLETSAKRDAIAEAHQKKQERKTPAIDLDHLVETVRQFIAEQFYWMLKDQKVPAGRREFWKGTFTELAKAWGWEAVPAKQLSTALRAVRDRLRDECGIEVLLPDDPGQRSSAERTVTIAYSCLIQPDWTDDEALADEERCAKLMDALPPSELTDEALADEERASRLMDDLPPDA